MLGFCGDGGSGPPLAPPSYRLRAMALEALLAFCSPYPMRFAIEVKSYALMVLLVVEPGFNSARALEEARLLISQMTAVQSVGVVLIGAQLPEELSSSVVG